jgi:ribokinase
VLAIKLGRKGSRIIEPSDRVRFVPPFPTRVADTTAAGDVFDAGFIAGIVKNHDLELSAKMGNAAASVAISRRGKTSLRFPKFSEVQSLIDRGSALRFSTLHSVATDLFPMMITSLV